MYHSASLFPPRRIPRAKARLIEAGVRLFTGGSGKNLTTRELALEAGVNHALISYHFGGMADLMAAVVERCIQDLRALFVPETEAFGARAREAAPEDLPPLLRAYAAKLLAILAGPEGAALLRALSSPEASALLGVYGRFSDQILDPLHHSFAVVAARARGIAEDSLEAVVLAQCMVAQGMAFFRGARPVLHHLGKEAFTEDESRRISRIVADALCRTAGLPE